MGIMQVITFLSGAKWFWKILNNWGAIRKIISNVEIVVKAMLSRSDTTPTCDEVKLLLDSAKVLFERELIDLPMVDEKEVARIFGNMENNLVCEIEKKEVSK